MNTRVTKNIRLAAPTKEALRVHAFAHGTTKNALLTEALARYADGEPIPIPAPPATVADKITIDPDVWDRAQKRAVLEGKTMVQVIEAEAQRAIAG